MTENKRPGCTYGQWKSPPCPTQVGDCNGNRRHLHQGMDEEQGDHVANRLEGVPQPRREKIGTGEAERQSGLPLSPEVTHQVYCILQLTCTH